MAAPMPEYMPHPSTIKPMVIAVASCFPFAHIGPMFPWVPTREQRMAHWGVYTVINLRLCGEYIKPPKGQEHPLLWYTNKFNVYSRRPSYEQTNRGMPWKR